MAVSIIGSGVAPITDNRGLTPIEELNYTFSTGLDESNKIVTTNDSEIDHDSLLNYSANEHIDWSDATINSDNFYTDGDVTCGNIATGTIITSGNSDLASLSLDGNGNVTNIETSITDSDASIPTSGAVVDYFATNNSSPVIDNANGVSVSTDTQILDGSSISNTIFEEGAMYRVKIVGTASGSSNGTYSVKLRKGGPTAFHTYTYTTTSLGGGGSVFFDIDIYMAYVSSGNMMYYIKNTVDDGSVVQELDYDSNASSGTGGGIYVDMSKGITGVTVMSATLEKL